MLSWRFGNAYLACSAMWRWAMWTWQLAKWSLQHGKVVRWTKLLAKWTRQNRKHQLDKDLRKIRKTNLAKLAKQRVFHNTFLDRVWGWWQVPIWWSWASWSHLQLYFTVSYASCHILQDCYCLHLHRCSVCGPVLEILDEAQQSNPVNPLKDCCDPEEMHNFQSPGGV